MLILVQTESEQDQFHNLNRFITKIYLQLTMYHFELINHENHLNSYY